MTDAETDALIEAACKTPQGRIKAGYALDQLNKLAPVYADAATRPTAEAVLAAWESGTDPLRKGLATAWLARARTHLAPAASAALAGAGKAKKAAARGYRQAEGKAGDVGAAAGEKLARSRLGAKGMAAARQAGGAAAQARMADRLKPNPRFAPKGAQRLEGHASERLGGDARPAPRGRVEQEATPSPRLQPGFLEPGHRNFGAEQARSRGGQPRPLDERSAAAHAEALSGAFRAGAAHAAEAHAGAAARHGRVAARHAFKAGLALAGAGAAAGGAVAGARTLSEAEHQERVNAARAPRHAVAKSADGGGADDLAKVGQAGRMPTLEGAVVAAPMDASLGYQQQVSPRGEDVGDLKQPKRMADGERIPGLEDAVVAAPMDASLGYQKQVSPHVQRMADLNRSKSGKPLGLTQLPGMRKDVAQGQLAKGAAAEAEARRLQDDPEAGKAPQGGLFAKDRNTKSGVGEDAELKMPKDTEEKTIPVAPHVAALANMIDKKRKMAKLDDPSGELAKAASERERAYAHFAGKGGPERGDPDITSSEELLGGKERVVGGDKAAPSKPLAGEAPHVAKLRRMHDKYKKG